MVTFITNSADETIAIGCRLGSVLKGGEVIAFSGGLGTGKTTFCRGIAQGLGCTDPVQSPTFTIANLYRGAIPFAHFDAYRITSADDLELAGFYDYLDQGAVVAVEWSERVAGLFAGSCIRVSIQQKDEQTRQITIEGAPSF